MNYLFIITTKSCPACIRMKGEDGRLSDDREVFIPGGRKWNADLFTSLITSGLKVFEVTMPSVRIEEGTYPAPEEFSYFGIDEDGLVYKTTHYSNDTYTSVSGHFEGKARRRSSPFQETVLDNLPKQLYNYMGAYPEWVFISSSEYGLSMSNYEHNMYAYAFNCESKLDETGKWKINIPSQRVREDILSVARRPSTYSQPKISYTVEPLY
jgi:hypothetical protein